MTLRYDSQIQAMQTTSVPSRGHSGSPGLLCCNTGQRRATQDADSTAVAGVD